MSKSTKDIVIRILTHSVLLLVLFVLQSMFFSRLRIFGVAPLILPVAVVGVALFEGPSWGGVFGVAAGLFCDAGFPETAVFFTILLTLVGMGAGLLSDFYLTKGLSSFILCSALALALIAFLQMFAFLVFDGVSPGALLKTGGLQTLYSILFVFPLYYFVRRISRRGRIDPL